MGRCTGLVAFITATTVISKSIRVYLQVCMGFGFLAFMPGSVGVGDTNERWC